MTAARWNQSEVCDLLLKMGANIGATDYVSVHIIIALNKIYVWSFVWSSYSFHFVVPVHRHSRCTYSLMVNMWLFKMTTVQGGLTAIHHAARWDSANVIKLLQRHGVDINIQVQTVRPMPNALY
jgi:ankyrin repeat protein